MRLTEFWRRMEAVFGPAYAHSWAADYSLAELGETGDSTGRTAAEALAAGVPAKEVWRVVCLHVDVPPQLR